MPNKIFLERTPLYRKFKCEVRGTLNTIPKPPIHMHCKICKSDQTFIMTNEYYGYRDPFTGSAGEIVRAEYTCAGCGTYKRIFLLGFGAKLDYVMKVGQYPPWEISIDKNLEQTLRDRIHYYKKGLVCESQSYGIGAYSYYRRITEEIIDELLDSVSALMDENQKKKYKGVLEKTKKTKVMEEKIELVKELLPESLRPGGVNPLSVLHSALSEGLHGKNDEECLEIATEIRESVVYLISQIIRSKQASRQFTESMEKILEKRKGKQEKKKENRKKQKR